MHFTSQKHAYVQHRATCVLSRAVPKVAWHRPKATASEDFTSIDQRLLNYRETHTLGSGAALHIVPLKPQWISSCAELLSSAFVDAKGIHAYNRFVRRQIAVYLETHINLIPRAVVLMALLEMPCCGGAEGAAADASPLQAFDPLQGRSFDSGSFDQEQLQLQSSSKANAMVQTQQLQPAGAPSPSGSLQAQFGAAGSRLQLVGSAEVSFNAGTRTSYVANNPPARCAYLCNMAVHPEQRRKGIARRLLASAEELAAIAGEHEMYLHLRLIDEPAAQLYRSSGFVESAKDGFLVQLLGQDRKFLMCKQLTGSSSGSSSSSSSSSAHM